MRTLLNGILAPVNTVAEAVARYTRFRQGTEDERIDLERRRLEIDQERRAEEQVMLVMQIAASSLHQPGQNAAALELGDWAVEMLQQIRTGCPSLATSAEGEDDTADMPAAVLVDIT